MRKVLHLRSSTDFWGPDRQILQLVKPMRSEGFQMEILVLHRRREFLSPIHPLVDRARRDGLEADQILDRGKFSPAVVSQIAQRLKQRQFSLLHTHEYKSDILGRMAGRLAQVKCIASVGGYTDSTLPLRVYKYLDFLALRSFSKVITASESLRRQLVTVGLSPQKVVTVHYGVDLLSLTRGLSRSDQVRDQLRIESDQPIVSIVGRLSREKGHRYFLESAKQTLSVFPRTMFLIIGDGPLRKQLEMFSISLGIQQSVSFLGYQEEVAAFIGVSDVLVLSSLTEGFPNVLLEAMILAKPVVATRVGGVPEMVKDGKTGLLVPPEDPKQLAEAILYMLRNPEKAARLGERGKELVSQEFNVETLARKIAEVYREVLA